MLTYKILKKAAPLIAILLLCAAVAGGTWWFTRPKKETISVRPGVVTDIKSMARLCSVEIYSEIPVRDTINNKVIVAIQKQHGTVSFDLEKLNFDATADTIRVVMPPEIVEIYESTDDNAYQVVDTKSLSLLTSSRLTNAEDNMVKKRLHQRSLQRLYADGVIANARREGRRQLAKLLCTLYRKPVIVSD